MADPALLQGVTAKTVDTHAENALADGNVSSSRFFEETLAALLSELATGDSPPT